MVKIEGIAGLKHTVLYFSALSHRHYYILIDPEKNSSLEVFRIRLDGALNNLVEKCPSAQELELDYLLGPFQPRPFHDFKIYVTVVFGDLRL